MADVVISLKIMPESPETDLNAVEAKAKTEIEKFGGEVGKVMQEPVAFGLKSLIIIFVSDEAKGGTDDLEKEISMIEGVNSAEVTDVRRALG